MPRTRTILRVVLALTAAAGATAVAMSAPRNPDIDFQVKRIDPGFSETAAVGDINKDGKPDIISSGAWYQGPTWIKHPIRTYEYGNGFDYNDNFTDFLVDVDGDGWLDDVQFSYNAQNITWLKNPGRNINGAWTVNEIDHSGPTEFAFMVDLDNDGKVDDLLPEFDRANVPAAWFEFNGKGYTKHVVSDRSYGHGIGAGDMNGDGRNDILTPAGWLEAPADVRAPGNWTFHPLDWATHPITASGAPRAGAPAVGAAAAGGGRAGAPAGAPGAAAGAAPAAPAAAPPVRNSSFAYIDLRDLNGDGRKDMITGMAHDYGLAWYEQTATGTWVQHVIDNSWSQSHAAVWADLNGDGHPDYITGKRFFAHNGTDPGERDPLGVYWYEYRALPAAQANARNGGIEWIRHWVTYAGPMGGGIQIQAEDIDEDGDIDIVAGGKDGLYIAENVTKGAKK